MGVGGGYARRQPEAGALHEAVRRGWPSVESRVPKRVREEVRRYLECGQLRYGFVQLTCAGCRELSLLAFSCKGRGFCPSCTTRRAVETALRLEAQLPEVAHRHYAEISFMWSSRASSEGNDRFLLDIEMTAVWLALQGVEERDYVSSRAPPGIACSREAGASPEGIEHSTFHSKVGLRVAARGRDALMTEVVANHSEIDAGLEERDGTAVAQAMEGDVSAAQDGELACCAFEVLGEDPGGAVTAQRPSARTQKNRAIRRLRR